MSPSPWAPLSSASTFVPGARSRRMRSTASSAALSASVTRSVRPLKRTSRGRLHSTTSSARGWSVLRRRFADDTLALPARGGGGRLAAQPPVRATEGVRVLLRMDLAHRGVAARLEDSHQAPARVLREDGGDRLAHGCGMVGEIVDHGYSFKLAAQLLPAFHAAKAAKARGDLVGLQSQSAAGRVSA